MPCRPTSICLTPASADGGALETRDDAAREAFLEMAKVWTQLGLQQQGLSSLVEDSPQLRAS
jgi:hypothetical protein